MKRMAFVVCLLSLSSIIRADFLSAGTWVQRGHEKGLTMTVEEVGTGLKLTYKGVGPDAAAFDIMTILTQLDGKDAPVLVNGKPTGQTMAIRKIDSHHTFTVLKSQGKEVGTSKAELSADGKVLKVENKMGAPGANGEGVTAVEYWDKK